MSDPADKSDDLIAELAKLMASTPGGDRPPVAPIVKPTSVAPSPSAPQPAPTVRIPGMDQPRPIAPVNQPAGPAVAAPAASATPAAPAASTSAASAPRAPITGAIRIPGMDNPAPVSTSAPVSKFDFGNKPAVAPIKQEPLSTLSERLAPQDPAHRSEPSFGAPPVQQPAPARVPSDLKPVTENRSFAQGPAIPVSKPEPAPAKPGSDFAFDFGFERNPPPSSAPPRPTAEPEFDPIADLIASSIEESEPPAAKAPEASAALPQVKPIPVPIQAPVNRAQPAPQPTPPQQSAPAAVGSAVTRPSSQPVPLKPVSVAPRAAETDRFASAPGVNIKPPVLPSLDAPAVRPANPAPRPELPHSDPMSEIESLIGEAVRVELHQPGPVRVQAVEQKVAPQVALEPDMDIDGDGAPDTASAPVVATPPRTPSSAPVVPPLTTPFAPRRAGLKDEIGHTTAEDAILAAAADTGATVDHVEPSMADERPYRRLKVKSARPSFASGGVRQYIGMAVAGTLLLAAGLGLYWVLNMGRADTLATGENAPQLTADATPIKEAPAPSAETEAEPARSPVLEQIGGTSIEPGSEQLVSTDQTAIAPVTRDVTNGGAAADTEGGLSNRKVRTVTVRPDGTIVSGDDAVAGAETLPVDRPNVPEMPTSETPNLLGDTTSVAAAEPSAAADGAPPALALPTETASAPTTAENAIAPVANAGGVAPRPISFPVRSTTAAAFSPTPEASPAPVTGAQTPNGQIDLLGSPVEVAAAPPAAVSPGSAGAYVQLSSSPSQADAQSSLRTLSNRYGALFGGSELVIQSADLGQKGTWYRVKLPAATLADANTICSRIKANGGTCIVTGG